MKEVDLSVVIITNIVISILYNPPMITLSKVPFSSIGRICATIIPTILLAVCFFVLLYELKLYNSINKYNTKLAVKIKLLFLYIYLQILLQFNIIFQYLGRTNEEIENLKGKTIQPCFDFMKISGIMHIIVVFGILGYLSV